MPRHEQTGNLILRRSGIPPKTASWTPNWRFDLFCLRRSLAERATKEGFRLHLREIEWRGQAALDAVQVVAPTIEPSWFDEDELRPRIVERHGRDGARCSLCGTWRWLGLPTTDLPTVHATRAWNDLDVVACPEWFGDGMRAFRLVFVRRELAELISAADPRGVKIVEPRIASEAE